MIASTPTERAKRFLESETPRFTAGLAALQARTPLTEAPAPGERYSELLALLGEIRRACDEVDEALADDPELLAETKEQYRRLIAPWMDQSPMMRHAKVKPSGYPGDFQMLRAIYERRPLAQGFAGLIDLFFLNTELGRAVPARLDGLREFLAEEVSARSSGVRVLDIACGPSREYSEGAPWGRRSGDEVVCVDFDEAALEYSQAATAAATADGASLSFVRYNALRLCSPRRFGDQHGEFDVIYSVGLFDYLSDRQCIGVFVGLQQLLRDEGVIYMAFKDAERYGKTDYQWLVDWYFFQRTEQDVRDLFAAAGCRDGELTMDRDATGIIMNFEMRPARLQRVDPAAKTVKAPAGLRSSPRSTPSGS